MILLGRDRNYANDTRTRVLDAAKQLGYKPNITAQGLKNRRSYLIGAVFSHLNGYYLSDFLAGFQATTTDHGCAPTLFVTHDGDSERQALDILQQRRVDGLIVNTTPQADSDQSIKAVRSLHKAGLPIVEVFGRTLGTDVPSVIADAYIAGRNAAQTLIDQGCSRLVQLTHGPMTVDTPRTAENWFKLDLLRGFNDAADQAGLTPHYIPLTDEQVLRSGPALAQQILADQQPDGVLTLSQTMTREFITAINTRPELAPEHFTLAATETQLAHFRFCRNKAAIHWAIREAAEQATDQLFNLLQNKHASDISIGPQIELIHPAGPGLEPTGPDLQGLQSFRNF